MAELPYDTFTKDLSRKCGDDVAAAIRRSMALHDDLGGKVVIALMGAGVAYASAAGAFAAFTELDSPEGIADALLEMVKPQIVASIAASRSNAS